MPYTPQIGQDIGIEVEVVNMTEGGARRLIERSSVLPRWQMHHDGSTLSTGFQITGLPFTVKQYRKEHRGSSNIVSQVSRGAEIVSPILDTTNSKWFGQVQYLCDHLRDTIHEQPGTYTSTHIHVAAGGLPVYTLKNMLRIWRFLEAVFFRLSCAEMGYHRGTVRKQYAYCRPLSMPLIIFDQNGRMRPSFDIAALLKADNLKDFFLGYGATDPATDPIRYHPARYTAFNLLPLLTIHTVEFRTFNETVNPYTIRTWVDLCKAVVNTAFTTKGLGDDDYPHLPLGYKGEFDLGMMQTLLELPDDLMWDIQRLWGMADWPEFDGLPLFNSNNENTSLNFGRDAETLPPIIDGQSTMMYAPIGGGRNSETEVYVFHNYKSYRSALSSTPVTVEEGRDMVRANFRQTEANENLSERPTPIPTGERVTRLEPRATARFTRSSRSSEATTSGTAAISNLSGWTTTGSLSNNLWAEITPEQVDQFTAQYSEQVNSLMTTRLEELVIPSSESTPEVVVPVDPELTYDQMLDLQADQERDVDDEDDDLDLDEDDEEETDHNEDEDN